MSLTIVANLIWHVQALRAVGQRNENERHSGRLQGYACLSIAMC